MSNPGALARLARCWPLAALAALAAGGAALLSRFDPRNTGGYPSCFFLRATGCWCPGCGATRALHALTQGDPGGAFRYNALVILGLPVLGLLVVRRPALPARVLWTALAVILVFSVARNVPIYPFTLLAPPP